MATYPDINIIIAAALYGSMVGFIYATGADDTPAPPNPPPVTDDSDGDTNDGDDPTTVVEHAQSEGTVVNPEPDLLTLPECWADVKGPLRDDLIKASKFLNAYTGRLSNPDSLDRETTCMALAQQMKGSELAKTKPPYRLLVEVFVSTKQSVL